MNKNGFIATSVLYSFFIVFITLFVALIANFIHNRILIDNVDDESLKVITANKSTRISDLVVGDKVRFSNSQSPIAAPGATQSANNLLNERSTWVVADIQTSGSQKIYYLLSDMKVGSQLSYKRPTEMEVRQHTITVDIFNEIKSLGLYDQALLYNVANPTNKIDISIPTLSIIKNASRNTSISNTIKNSIFNTTSNFTVYADQTTGSYTAGNYYNMRYYTIPKGASASVITKYCNSSLSGNTITYPSSNVFGYTNVGTDAKKTTTLINYCLYANPATYTHSTSDKVVHVAENNVTDLIGRVNALGWDLTTGSYYDGGANAGHDIIGYNLRLMAKIVVTTGAENTYISGGKGTSVDPYLITNGQQGRYQSSKDKINLTSKSLADIVMRKANFASVKEYSKGATGEAYVFSHAATAQTGVIADYRYLGTSPNNYVKFNNEIWRIIGVFNQDGENRVKLVRNTGLGVQWDSSDRRGWSESTLAAYLNSTYKNSLSNLAKSQIADSTFFLGTSNVGTPEATYANERGFNRCGNDNINSVNSVGLMYLSDFLFIKNANGGSWLLDSPNNYYITRSTSCNFPYFPSLTSSAEITSGTATQTIRPVVYLKNSIQITGGTGTAADPYLVS